MTKKEIAKEIAGLRRSLRYISECLSDFDYTIEELEELECQAVAIKEKILQYAEENCKIIW